MRSMPNSSRADGVSVVVPVCNGERWLPETLAAIVAECADRPHEILVVDDGSRDQSATVARGFPGVRVTAGEGRGAAAAVNLGLRHARFELVAQIDQDVRIGPGWLDTLVAAMAGSTIAAAQGWYSIDPGAPALSRMMAMDLEQRYLRLRGGRTDHVCTGNVVWRRDAILAVGGLDESLGYGYDNDLSYRLTAAGFSLRICPEARSHHRWREGVIGYWRQQYGFGYGRIDLVSRHRRRAGGDAVSPPMMMAHPLVLALALVLLGIAGGAWLGDRAAWPWAGAALVLIAVLALERAGAAAAAFTRWGDPAALLFPVMHLVRDVAWIWAMVVWSTRRILGRAQVPAHSMRARTAAPGPLRLAEDQ